MTKKGRPRVYRHYVRCLECGSNAVVKNGKQKGKQTFLCRDCNRRFTPDAERIYRPKTVKEQAIKMFCKGMNKKAISRTLNVNYSTVQT